jgi:hypothetical protein
MKTITRRISKLEERFAARCDRPGRSMADEIREARRRRYLAEGREFEIAGWKSHMLTRTVGL